MKCRCPTCGRTVLVAPEMLDFPTRCDRCRTFLITRTPDECAPPEISEEFSASHLLPLGGFAERNISTGTQLDVILSRRLEKNFSGSPTPATPVPESEDPLAELARLRENRPTPVPRSAHRGAALPWILIAGIILIALASVIGAHHLLQRSVAAPSPAVDPIAPNTTPPRPARAAIFIADTPEPGTTRRVQSTPTTNSTGELFPDDHPSK